jgi:hypothetical protein
LLDGVRFDPTSDTFADPCEGERICRYPVQNSCNQKNRFKVGPR